ncbi:MAG: head-tail connector protein [Bacillota bacterium]|nr:head-tail connector protein [Bacillota bacterium]
MIELTLEEIKGYLYVDSDDENSLISSEIESARIYIDSMVTEGYKSDEKAIKLSNTLMKKLVHDMYNNRSTEIPGNTKRDLIVTSILDKLSTYEVVETDVVQ